MGLVYADIELINTIDLSLARRHYMSEEEVKRMPVRALVDTDSYMLCINETVQSQLQLPIMEKRTGQLANGEIVEYVVVSQVELRFKNRCMICNALVLPGDSEVLLGKNTINYMDLVIDNQSQELKINPQYPDRVYVKLSGVR